MKSVRLGIIGMGNIGSLHAQYLLDGKVPRCELTAVASTSTARLTPFAQRGLKIFAGGEALINSGAVDAVVVATPHFQHASLGIAAFRAGLHLLVEKPIAAHKADAQRLIAVRRAFPRLVFCAMFQLRAEPRYMEIKKLLASGQLGRSVRFSWIATDWFRSGAYYASSQWRATWKGEGGGVLINQCLHQLDMLQWLLGMPARARAFVQLGRFHNIETEDSVSAYLEMPDTSTGVFVSSTGEAPGTNRLEIAGEMGRLVLENDRLTFTRNAVSMFEQSKTSPKDFKNQKRALTTSPLPPRRRSTRILMRNFVNAILDGAPLIAPGEEGIHSLELANAFLYSGLTGQTVEFPLDAAAYERKLNELIAASKFEKKVVKGSNDDFSKSFSR